jgi:hypothetical protein
MVGFTLLQDGMPVAEIFRTEQSFVATKKFGNSAELSVVGDEANRQVSEPGTSRLTQRSVGGRDLPRETW